MALTKATGGNRMIWNSGDNVIPGLAVSGYTAPVAGDFVKTTTTGNSYDHCAVNDVIAGVVIATNSGNGILSIARNISPFEIVVEYLTSVTVGDKVVSNGDRGTIIAGFDRVKTDNTNGTGRVRAKDANSPGGTGTCVVEW